MDLKAKTSSFQKEIFRIEYQLEVINMTGFGIIQTFGRQCIYLYLFQI